MKNHPKQSGEPEPPRAVEKHSTMSPLSEDSTTDGLAGVTLSSTEHGVQPDEAFEDLQRRVNALCNRADGTGEKTSVPAVPAPSKDKSPISLNTEQITPHSTPAHKFTYEAYILQPCASTLSNNVNWSYKIERLHLDEAALQAHVSKLGPDFDILAAVGALLPEQIRLIQEGIKHPFERLMAVQFGAALDLVTPMGTFRVKPVLFVIRTVASASPVVAGFGGGQETVRKSPGAGCGGGQDTVRKSPGAGTRCGIPEHGPYPLLKASDGTVAQFMTITPELACKSALGSVSFEESRVVDYAARRKYADCSCLVFPPEEVSLGFDGHVAVGACGPFVDVCTSAGFGHGAQSVTGGLFGASNTNDVRRGLADSTGDLFGAIPSPGDAFSRGRYPTGERFDTAPTNDSPVGTGRLVGESLRGAFSSTPQSQLAHSHSLSKESPHGSDISARFGSHKTHTPPQVPIGALSTPSAHIHPFPPPFIIHPATGQDMFNTPPAATSSDTPSAPVPPLN